MSQDSIKLYANILAENSLNVSYSSKTDTSYYDINDHSITMPVLSWANQDVEQMLVSHEIGHYFHTDEINSDIDNLFKKYGHDLVNVVEDIYIESKLKESYPGLKFVFKNGYKCAWNEKFFGFKTIDEINHSNFIDRINLYFKGMDVISSGIKFTDEEKSIIASLYMMTTRKEYYANLQRIYEYILKNKQMMIKTKSVKNKIGDSSSTSSSSSNTNETNETNEGNNSENSESENNNDSSNSENNKENGKNEESLDNDEKTDSSDSDSSSNSSDNNSSDNESDNQSNNDSSSSNNTSDTNNQENSKGESNIDSENTGTNKSKEDEEQHIDVNKDSDFKSESYKAFNETVKERIKSYKMHGSTTMYFKSEDNNSFVDINKDIDKLIKDIHSKPKSQYINNSYNYNGTKSCNLFIEYGNFVNKLAKSSNSFFRQFKNAKTIKNRRFFNTGLLDRKNIVHYKTRDDIFIKRCNKENEQSHAVVILLDSSGSMEDCVYTAVTQASILGDFCHQNKIPFKIFTFGCAFGTASSNSFINYDDAQLRPLLVADDKHWTSDRLGWLAYSKYTLHFGNYEWRLMSTPTNATLFCAVNCINEWKKQGIQKISTFLVTDGSSCNDNCLFSMGDSENDYRYHNLECGSIYSYDIKDNTKRVNIDNHDWTYTYQYAYSSDYYRNSDISYGDSIVPSAILRYLKEYYDCHIVISYIRSGYAMSKIPFIMEAEVPMETSKYKKEKYKWFNVEKDGVYVDNLFLMDSVCIADYDYLTLYLKCSELLKVFAIEFAKSIA